jgi:hypothetical protein
MGADRGYGRDFGYAAEPEIAFTPKSDSRFLSNLEMSAAVELEGEGGLPQPAINLGWGQRWLQNGTGSRWVPTIGGLTEVNLPVQGGLGPKLEGDNLSETLTIAEDLGPGSLYLNGVATGVLGDEADMRHLVLGMRVGYKWVAIDDKLLLIADYCHEQSESLSERPQNTAELSVSLPLGEHLTLGPGLVFGLDANPETPRIGGGLMLLLE